MISDSEREAIKRSVDRLDVASWRPLDDRERDLLRRALGDQLPHDGDERAS